jgi:transposase
VANSYKIKLISQAPTKTDRPDALFLAKLQAGHLLPSVWVPPLPVRERRTLVAHRRQLTRDRSAAKNHLHGVLHRHGIVLPDGNAFSEANRAWWRALKLSAAECLSIRHELLPIQHQCSLLNEVETEVVRLSVQVPWIDQVAFLIQLPGVGLQSAMTPLGAIGDIARFPTAKQLVGYTGLDYTSSQHAIKFP